MIKLFFKRKDGGEKSTVTGFWIIEIKSLFSIVLLCFHEGSREAFHSHAFNGLTWWLKGEVNEQVLDGEWMGSYKTKRWTPSFVPKYTPRNCFHRVFGIKKTYALSFRGPWSKTWNEYIPADNKFVTLTHGRKIVNE